MWELAIVESWNHAHVDSITQYTLQAHMVLYNRSTMEEAIVQQYQMFGHLHIIIRTSA